MRDDQAAALVDVLRYSYPTGEKMSAEAAAMYAYQLSAYDYEETKAAIRRIIATNVHFPAIAEIVEQIVAEQLDLPEPMLAWQQVMLYEGEMRQWTRDSEREERLLSDAEYDTWEARGRPPLVPSPARPAPEVMLAVNVIGGLDRIRTADNIDIVRAHFRDAYKELLRLRENEMRQQIAAPATRALTMGGGEK